jgi:hypothetical protein
MSEATLTIRPMDAQTRRVVLDCHHGTTSVVAGDPPSGQMFTDADVVRVALAKHFEEEGCRCIGRLWRQYWGAELGELALVRGTP